jgi:hypothetical protein
VSQPELRSALQGVTIPGEAEAEERAWAVLRGAFSEREVAPRRARILRPLLAAAVLAVLLAAAVSPPGRALGDWIRDRVAGEEHAEPGLVRLPTSGNLLVVSSRGAWVVRPDGGKRFLGEYKDASFSPHGLFVVATAGHRVVAVEPDGDPRWSLTRSRPVADARWAPSGYRVAYREADTLRVVAGDGVGDRLLARGVAPVAPAWRPTPSHLNVLAYADQKGAVYVVNVDTGAQLWRTKREAHVRRLLWSGRSLLVLTRREGRLYRGRHGVRWLEVPKGHAVLGAAFGPTGGLAYTDFDRATERTTVALSACNASGACILMKGTPRLFPGAGRMTDVVWSPNGRWLLVGWPDADQLVFLRLPGVTRKIVAADDVRREFDPGGPTTDAFPRLAGWCCR